MKISARLLMKLMPGCKLERAELFADPFQSAAIAAKLTTKLRLAHFFAQMGHESGSLRWLEELASGAAYEGRVSLGNVNQGDGRKFKGRGPLQLTGRANYQAYQDDRSEFLKTVIGELSLIEHPELVATVPAIGADVAGWYWRTRNINREADRDDVVAVTKKINGGLAGLADREHRLEKAKEALAAIPQGELQELAAPQPATLEKRLADLEARVKELEQWASPGIQEEEQ